MLDTLCVLLICLAALVGLAAGYALALVRDRYRDQSAKANAIQITEQSRKEAENILKEAELKAKDEFFRRREEFNKEMERERGELREQERRLEKREDTLDQKHQAQLKKDRLLEHTQRKLHEKREALEKRGVQLEELIQKETQQLHAISTLSREQAEKLLLERLDKELSAEIAERIQHHEEQLKAT